MAHKNPEQYRNHNRRRPGLDGADDREYGAIERMRMFLAHHPWASKVEIIDDPFGRVLLVRVTDLEAGRRWRQQFGPSYAHLRIRIVEAQVAS